MARPTVHDIAKNAGVSLATVDRVLNERPGVREKTIERVHQAIEKIGYIRDIAAANLAKQRDYNLVFIIPERIDAHSRKLREAITEAKLRSIIERTNITIVLVPANNPHELVKALNELDTEQIDGVAILAPETPQLRDAIGHLKENGLAVVAIISNLPNSQIDQFIGINNIAAGRTAGLLLGRFLGQNPSKILLLAGSMLARGHAERRLGFDQIMAEKFSYIEVLPTIEVWDDAELIEQLLPQALANNPQISGIYSLGGGNSGLAKILDNGQLSNRISVIAHELDSVTRDALKSDIFDAVIAQDFGHVVRSAVRMLRATSDGLEFNPAQERIRIEIYLKENLL